MQEITKNSYINNKIMVMNTKENEKLIFVFQFTDGLYFIEYNQKLFSTFEIQDITYYREGITPKSVKHISMDMYSCTGLKQSIFMQQ